MESVAQYWQHGKTNKNTNRCEVFALGQAAERRSLAAHDSHGQPRVWRKVWTQDHCIAHLKNAHMLMKAGSRHR